MIINSRKLRDTFHKIAKEKNTTPQVVMQYYMLERFLERIASSKYRDYYVVKGGFLIVSMVGLDRRATMDMDATMMGFPLDEGKIREMMEEIIKIDAGDGIAFSLKTIKEIRKSSQYTGYRASLVADYYPMSVSFKLDITAGDMITPREIEYSHKLMLEDRSIAIKAYNVNTVLAEKLEAILSRSRKNTRLRDYYDVYILTKFEAENIDLLTLKLALERTASKRGTSDVLDSYRETMEDIFSFDPIREQWKDYQIKNEYARDLSFDDVYEATLNLLNSIFAFPEK